MKSLWKRSAITLAAAIAAGICVTNAPAQTVIEEWTSAKLPPPPALKAATLVPAETALLVMDFTVQTCSAERRPRCAASVPKVQKLVAGAPAKRALAIYSAAGPRSPARHTPKDRTPPPGGATPPPLRPGQVI